MDKQSPQYIKPQRKSLYWDWWRENPVEIILVVLILVLFAFAPWEGAGISEQVIDPAEITVVP